MKVFASSWDLKLLAIDSRNIFAVCSTEVYNPHYQTSNFILGLVGECMARGIDSTGKKYQVRLNVFRDINDDFIDGCEYAFGSCENEEVELVQQR